MKIHSGSLGFGYKEPDEEVGVEKWKKVYCESLLTLTF
jgi:hypothetical protein